MKRDLDNENIDSSRDALLEKRKAERQRQITLSLFAILAVLVLTLLLLIFVCSPAMIDGESMNPTLTEGQIVMISKVNKKPKVGDIVVYNKPTEKTKKVIKRVVGVAGDTFYFIGNNINGTAHIRKEGESSTAILSNDQLFFLLGKYTDQKTSGPYAGYFYFTIGEGEIFTMGDNTSNSIDGRNYGPIKIKDIIGIKI